MDQTISREEFLAALEIVEKYMAQVRRERDETEQIKRSKFSLERFMNTTNPSKRLWTALVNYQDKWGINPTVDEMTSKRLAKTLGFGKKTIAEFEALREDFIKNA